MMGEFIKNLCVWLCFFNNRGAIVRLLFKKRTTRCVASCRALCLSSVSYTHLTLPTKA